MSGFPTHLSWHFQVACLCLFQAIPFCTWGSQGKGAGCWNPWLGSDPEAVVSARVFGGKSQFKNRIACSRHGASFLFVWHLYLAMAYSFLWGMVLREFCDRVSIPLSLPIAVMIWLERQSWATPACIRHLWSASPGSGARTGAYGTARLPDSLSAGQGRRRYQPSDVPQHDCVFSWWARAGRAGGTPRMCLTED